MRPRLLGPPAKPQMFVLLRPNPAAHFNFASNSTHRA
jgi:hypothetical protein